MCWDEVPLFRGFLMVRDLCFTAFEFFWILWFCCIGSFFLLWVSPLYPGSRSPKRTVRHSSYFPGTRIGRARMRWMNGASGKGVTGLPGILDIPR